MKQVIYIILITVMLSVPAFAQMQTFDGMTFTPPKGWTAQQNGTAKVFTKIDKEKNTLGIIMLYPSINSSGDANEDFKYVWKQIVQNSFGASGKPETEAARMKGFTLINGGELIKYEGIQALAMLTILSGKGKVISVLTITNEPSYANVTQTLLDGMTIEAKEIPKSNSTGNSTANVTGDTGSYTFTTPPGWSLQRKSSEIVLKKDRYIISMLPFTASSGNLESDATRVMFQTFNGWVAWTKDGFKADHAEFEKGKTMQGFNYFLMKKMLNKANDDSVRTDAIVLLVEVGNKIAIMVGSEPFQSVSSESLKALDFILYDLNFTTAQSVNYDLKKELLGAWTNVGSGAGSSYTYHPNGTYLWGGASQSTVSRDAYTDKVTTTSFASNGSYALNGNILTTTFRSTGKSSKDRIRFYYTRDIGSSEMFGNRKSEWVYKMGKLSIDGTVSGSIYYTKD